MVASRYANAVLADSPLLYLRMNESSGTTAFDSSGNGRDATHTSVGLSATGLLVADSDKAASYNGSSSHTDITGAAWMQVPNFTVECMVATSVATGSQMLIERDGSNSQRHFQTYIGSGKPGFLVFKNDTPVYNVIDSTTSIADGKPHHLAFTYDGATQKIYIDGQLNLSAAYAGPSNSGVTTRFTIGAYSVDNLGSWQNYVNGSIDEVAYYGSALSAVRIAEHYAASTALFGGWGIPI